MAKSAVVPVPWVLMLLASACGDRALVLGTSGAEEPQTGDDAASTGAIDAPDRDPPSATPASDEEPEETDDGGVGFIDSPDGGGSFQCDLFAQDCRPGEKCNVWANDGGAAWNSTKCVPIDPDPDAVGEECTVVGSAVSGVDSCALGAICWNVDAEGIGTCVLFCQGSADNPICDDPTAVCEGRHVPLCLPVCCPLEQACPQGEACYPIGEHFACAPDASGDQGAFGEGCEYINGCDAGLLCLGASAVPGCAGAVGCCTPFCEVGSEQCALHDPQLQCMPWFIPGQAPPGFEAVGACTIPQ